jgi:nicotinamidase-related amidase
MKSALIVIDVQKHFAVEKAEDLPEKIKHHIENTKYDHILFTKLKNIPSSNFFKILNWKKVTHAPATDLHPLLAPFANGQNTFEKTTYSAFKSKAFTDYLIKHNVGEIFICGINIDACVLATAFEAFDLGYKFKIIEELCSVASMRDDYEASAKTIITRNLKRKIPK